jgi:hypothetical protein
MDLSQFVDDMASDLLEYQKYETAAGSYLYRQIFRAARRINNKFQWRHQIASTTITATGGNQGPYSLPSDFKGMLREERLTYVYTYDKIGVPIVPDGDYQAIYPVYWKRADNKLYFVLDPESKDYTFYYRKKLATLAQIDDAEDNWPQELETALAAWTMYYVLKNSSDTLKEALTHKVEAKDEMQDAWVTQRKGDSLQDSRHPRDIYGNVLSDGAGRNRDDWYGVA